MEYSWVDLKQALEQLKLDPHYACMMEDVTGLDDEDWGFDGTPNETAVQEPNQPPGPAVQATPAIRPIYYCWENGRLQPQEDRGRQQALRCNSIEPDGFREAYRLIKFFIRHPLDPTGSCSPTLKVWADTTMGEIFDWYLSETYEGVLPDGGPQSRKDYCLMEIDLANRTTGKRYFYWDVKFSGLRIEDTEWWDDKANGLRRITVASNDRMVGNYQPCESQRMFGQSH